ncbi:UvrD-helicase domain-containing protein [Lawsonibacter hominis]|uniref:DNA 3'-5' helicase n=1 Tax=Lawsonibacter hominis TaxID=2763053 RepID=A0A8J6J2I9_9FIRM|nr:ATP-dependent helicase [Lawsonibacter hominis]MBC5735082.1 ATP-dependent helicase [Lawsonibacter hominis]
MPNPNLTDIRDKISTQHEGDERQLEVIFSDSPRIIVEAPAGYGKTTTMISRIAYLFAVGRIPNPKRILGLTFSVNAALKVKRDVAEKMPSLLGSPNSPVAIGDKVTITNYHGFCKGLLKKYGYLISDSLKKDVNLFHAIGDHDAERQWILKAVLSTTDIQVLKEMDASIKEARVPSGEAIQAYNQIVIQKLLPHEYITHNAVILFVLDILARFPEVKKFYQSYYPLIVVDEFQDTNCIAWELLKSIISDQTQLLFLGDPLQRIYGFIGALPNIMSTVVDEYQMTKISLSKNYRFRNNPEMLKLDRNVRENATALFSPTISHEDIANVPAFWGLSQQEEAGKVVSKVKQLIENQDSKIAILFKGRGKNAEIVETELSKQEIPYFYGMFKDDDTEYVEFHNKCQSLFIQRFGRTKTINKAALIKFADSVKEAYATSLDKTTKSLLQLLDALVEKVSIDYADLIPEDKYLLLMDIFENRQLKQSMEYVDSQVILSTVHGAKGLEWDHVMVCDVEQWVFTFVCKNCPNKYSNGSACRLPNPIPHALAESLLDDFCVFYVALTRARKQVYISASKERFNASGVRYNTGKICCFALANGIKLVDASSPDTA